MSPSRSFMPKCTRDLLLQSKASLKDFEKDGHQREQKGHCFISLANRVALDSYEV